MRYKEKRTTLFRRWLLIEMCFLAFMTLISTSVYLYADYHIKRQLDALHESNANRAGAEITAVFDAAQTAVDEYILNPSVRTLAGTGVSAEQRKLADLIDDIKQTNSASDAIAEIIIYLKNDDIFISSAGIMDGVLFSQLYNGSNLNNCISSPTSDGRFIAIYYGRGGYDTAVYTQQFMDSAFVCAVIDSSRIEQILAKNLQDEKSTFFVLTEEYELLFALDNDIATEAADLLDFTDTDTTQTITLSNRDYVRFVSENDGLKTVLLIDHGNYLTGHLRIQRTAILLLAASIIIGLGVSYYITRFKYGPIQEVFNATKAITPEHIFTGSKHELEQIKNAVEFINAQKEEASSLLQKHNTHIKDNALKMLLDGGIEYNSMTGHIKSLLDIHTDTIYTTAVIDPDKNTSSAISTHLRELSNIAKHAFIKGGRLVLIFDCTEADAIARLQKADASGILHGTAAVGISGISSDGLRESYRHAMNGLNRKILPGTPQIIPPLEDPKVKIITISAEDDIQLSGFIQSGDEKSAISLLDRLTHIPDTDHLDFFSFKSYLFSIANVVIRCSEGAMKEDNVHKLLSQLNNVFEREDHVNISRALHSAVTAAAESYRQKKNSGNKELNRTLIGFIENRISDTQLSADMIAEAMSLNAAYLRRFFKEQNGISLWDFINFRRIEKAKNLLVSTDSGVKNIAEDCGYISITTFSRAFRRFTGMTPGGYRTLYH